MTHLWSHYHTKLGVFGTGCRPDRRYDFILHPGDFEPDLDGLTVRDLDSLLKGWLGHDKPITILDLSGVPSAVLIRLIGSILRIIYEALYWSREKTEGGVLRPLLVVMEEAHRYLNEASGNVALDMVKRIAKEGRKYGVGAMIVSQRPAEIDETVFISMWDGDRIEIVKSGRSRSR
jgi:DNA helicase HerA-like ATPase